MFTRLASRTVEEKKRGCELANILTFTYSFKVEARFSHQFSGQSRTDTSEGLHLQEEEGQEGARPHEQKNVAADANA